MTRLFLRVLGKASSAICLTLLALALGACAFMILFVLGAVAFGQEKSGPGQPNVVLIMPDDLSTAYVEVYGHGDPADQPPTPTMDGLAQLGMRSTNCKSMPRCSPTRATILLGELPWRHGIGFAIPSCNFAVPADHDPLPSILAAAGYQTAMVGKWHMGCEDPRDYGFDYFRGGWPFGVATNGTPGNEYGEHAVTTFDASGMVQETSTTYATVQRTDDGLAWIDSLDCGEPFFLVMSYDAPHKPTHLPPLNLHSYGTVTEAQEQHEAMVESLDREIGRLLDGIAARGLWPSTYFLLVGDNGDDPDYSILGVGQSKGTLKEGGIGVPFLAVGPGIGAGQVDDRLFSVADLYETILDLCGVVGPLKPDSHSWLLPQRQSLGIETFTNAGPPHGNERTGVMTWYPNALDAEGDPLIGRELVKYLRHRDNGSEQLYILPMPQNGTDGPGRPLGPPFQSHLNLARAEESVVFAGRPEDL